MPLKLPFGSLLATALMMLTSVVARAQNQPIQQPAAYAAPTPAAVRQVYAAASPTSPLLYNGPEYANYAMRYAARVGHQFFLMPELQPGSAFYREQPFDNLQLQYDVVLDQVIIKQPTSPLTLRLVNEKLDRFTIGSHRFEKFRADSVAGSLPTTGYYELLTEGPVRLLARRAKRQLERIESRVLQVTFVTADRLYAYKEGRYYPLNSKSAVQKLLADREPEVRAYLRQSKLKLTKKRFENDVLALVAYYNQLPLR